MPVKQIIFIFKCETMFIIVISFLINFFMTGIFAKEEYRKLDINLENAGLILI